MKLVDPTHESTDRPALAPRPARYHDGVLAILFDGRTTTRRFVAHLARLVVERWRVAEVVQIVKSNEEAMAGPELLSGAERWSAMLIGIGDSGAGSAASLRDAVAGERLGVPSVGIIAAPFVEGARMMADALGMAGYGFAVVDHPLSLGDGDLLEAQARSTIEQADVLLGHRP